MTPAEKVRAVVADAKIADNTDDDRMAWTVIESLARDPEVIAYLERAERDAARLDYIERTFSGMTDQERYLPIRMIWGKGRNGRTLREACDKYMKRDTANAGDTHE